MGDGQRNKSANLWWREGNGGEMLTRLVLLPSNNSGAPYTLSLVNGRKWEQQHGKLPEPPDAHVNSHVYYPTLVSPIST